MDFQFLELGQEQEDSETCQPATYVRKVFYSKGSVKKAVLSITALGVYKGYLNGKELDKQLLRPGFTDYHSRVQYQSYDITEKIVDGGNVIGVVVGDGWYRGALGVGSKRNFYGTRLQLAAVLEITDADGTRQVITDSSWRETQDGPLRENDLKNQEIVDLRREMPGWNAAGYDDSSWRHCRIGHYSGKAIPQEGEALIEQERLTPMIMQTPNGEKILDFGQNLAGHVEFTVTGKAGRVIRLLMGEALDENGNFTQKNFKPSGKGALAGEVGQKVTLTMKEGTQTYKSLFLISGYRYVKPENWPEEIKPENFVSIAVYSDLKETGTFICSDEQINQLARNVRWSQKSNFVDIPTDCPTRERAGWTGDINVFAETACYFTDTRKFLHKWLHDFMLLQKEDGSSPYIVPEYPLPKLPDNSAGWTDALIHVPMTLYAFYGDTEILQEVYPYACRFVDYRIRQAKKRHPAHAFRTRASYRHILDTGYHFGEWLEPGHVMKKDLYRAVLFPDAEAATAWHYLSVKRLADMAEILGLGANAAYYAKEAAKIREAYRKEFLKGGMVHSKRQCRYVRPVFMGLSDAEESGSIVEELNRMCVQNDYKIGTGFLTTYKILPVLCDHGYVETAYKMLKNPDCPGWMYEIGKGATTVWENWLGINETGVPQNSLNHYAPGAVAAWLFQYCAGIKPLAPGFSKVCIRPMPGGGLTFARAAYQSVQGEIISDWKMEKEKFCLKVCIPEGVRAEVVLPNGVCHEVRNGIHEFVCTTGKKGGQHE